MERLWRKCALLGLLDRTTQLTLHRAKNASILNPSLKPRNSGQSLLQPRRMPEMRIGLDRLIGAWLMACVRRLVLNGMSPLNGVPFELNGSRWPAPAIALIQSFGYHHARRPEPGDPLARPATDTPYAKSSMLKRSANGHRQTCVDRRQSRHLHRVRVHGDDT